MHRDRHGDGEIAGQPGCLLRRQVADDAARFPIGISTVDRQQRDVRTEIAHRSNDAVVRQRVPGVVEPHAVELDDVADEPRRHLVLISEGVAVFDPDGMPGRYRRHHELAELHGRSDPTSRDAPVRDPRVDHERHERLGDHEPGVRACLGDERPRRKVEVVPVLVRREDGRDAEHMARIDDGIGQAIRARRKERIDQDEVAAALQGKSGLAEGDDRDGLPRRTPSRQARTRRSLRSRRRGRHGLRLVAGLLHVAARVGECLAEVGGHRVASSSAVVGGDGVDDPLVLAAAVRLHRDTAAERRRAR